MNDHWEIIKTITEAEHHFNNLCFKIRTLASTWLLATFAGVGFLITKTIDQSLSIGDLTVLLCWAGSLGIFTLWILDIQIYQKILNAWFEQRQAIESQHPEFPQLHQAITSTQPGGRATNLIKLYYIGLFSAPLLLACYICLYKDLASVFAFGSIALLVIFCFVIYRLSPSGQEIPTD
ncbi:hypothetical protein DV711_11140 [Motiliproteus coralliicola]|uniref:Uncharacterized protein n=1 Tax=Motiliproteus coralliicola TaxID=2283196 RepID=A0A369WCI7_9GAMM|nr:hypothetical protein [Motiliproteus coralliicola]RDE19442.1 hypothetical protein DV711_11140 [Motiliproteus coralliicola]